MSELRGYSPNYAVPPGDVLEEHLDAASMTQAELSDRLGLSGKHVNRIIAGHEPVTPETALKLESVFGLPAHVWLNMEARFQESKAREAESLSLAEEKKWLDYVPYKSMIKLGWIERSRDPLTMVRSLREFFRVGSLDYLPGVWSNLNAAYRSAPAYKSHEWALVAWLSQGERLAELIQCKPFDAIALKSSLSELKALSRLPGIEFVEPLTRRCADLGVAMIFIPPPDGARVCGATRWLTSDKALIQLSLRYKTDDQLWFTIFHELGHVLLHGKKAEYIDFEKPGEKSESEQEADRFAAQTLIDQKALKEFALHGDFTVSAVESFAEAQGVAAGIVVGQLQHLKALPFASGLNRLKGRFKWEYEIDRSRT
jgi:HTH-type transcriptional regulator / antitoxin HigA